ncbi:ferritin-like domain-containing protein [Aureispira sp. CCB-QB1]|uniref:ferritin-like domain-containing protein n=1 Tax=Aureispira sp. CCB-QB1 TaxID=1313421 RepID=UPI0006970D06|nr:ferritin-like domain-containing protein [Aureispira sp. CCB-QB1]
MQNRYSRHLIHLFKQPQRLKSAELVGAVQAQIPAEFNPKDWLSYLLHVDAELEHSLMVQYLYAAYSLGGPQVLDKYKAKVHAWQEIVLGIAKEEMGHFVSVQNVLRLIGAPLNFNRQDFPWDSVLYPFEFKLEPFSKDSLAKYVYAESPENWLNDTDGDDDEMKEIKAEIKAVINTEENHGDPISVLFKQILAIIEDDQLIPDDVFLSGTYPFQAKFDEWGRGYKGGARGNSSGANPQGTPDVLVAPLLSRTDAITALNKIAEQGEAMEEVDGEDSHFERFLTIYKEWRKMPQDFEPTRPVATNPTVNETVADPTYSPSEGLDTDSKIDVITNPVAKTWGNLFNVRYRMLLTFLTHSFLLDGGFNNSGAYSPRGTIIHATFGEMYNLRGIAGVLVQLPIAVGSSTMAGPPFLTPYTMELPLGEISRWKVHQDLVQASKPLIEELLLTADEQHKKYLYSLKEADENFQKIAMAIINVPA